MFFSCDLFKYGSTGVGIFHLFFSNSFSVGENKTNFDVEIEATLHTLLSILNEPPQSP